MEPVLVIRWCMFQLTGSACLGTLRSEVYGILKKCSILCYKPKIKMCDFDGQYCQFHYEWNTLNILRRIYFRDFESRLFEKDFSIKLKLP